MAVKVDKDYDFAGYVTKNDVHCSDGRTIRQNAFAHQDGQTVPLVWNHGHNDIRNVIGRVLLQNREDGVYGYGYINHTDMGDYAREQVKHKDITSMSIYANRLKEKAGNVMHGMIREVSLVLAGANDGAFIDDVVEHDDEEGCSAFIYPYLEEDFFYHSDRKKDDDEDEDDNEGEDENSEESDDEDEDNKEEDSKEPDEEEDEDEKLKHADDEKGGKTVGELLDDLDEEHMQAVQAYAGALVNAAVEGKNSNEEDEDVKHNAFDNETQSGAFLSHADQQQIIADAKRVGSLRDAYLAHCESLGMEEGDALQHDDVAAKYGIDHIEALFPEYKNLNVPPEWIKRDTTWVSKVLNAAHHVPFSRIKSMFANLTEDEARAKGYIKGNLKKEQVFSLLKRTTDPQTIYKKQKLDRDDQIDITDFDVVAWIKSEMRGQLDEELARAMLVGDGRLSSDDDHISEDHIRPIWKDADLFAVKVTITMKAGATDDDRARAFLRANLKARKYYKGSGSPSMFTTDSLLSDVLLLEDGIGRTLYETDAVVATKCRVKEIVPVEIMEGLTDDTQGDLAAIVVNMSDYNVGADKGGAVAMFEDFDIDYNQNKYLIETRCSGALVKPYSALIFSFKQGVGENTVISFSGDGMDEFTIKDDAQG